MNNASTKEEIIETAGDIIQRIGYHSFAYKQIAEKLGIRNASIHYYFPSKADLAVAIIENDQHAFQQMIRSLAVSTPTEKAEALLQVYKQQFDKRKLCVASTFGVIYNDIEKKVQIAVTAHVQKVCQWLTATFEAGARSGEFTFRTRTLEEVAADWSAALGGSLAIGRLLGKNHFNRTIESLRKSLHE